MFLVSLVGATPWPAIGGLAFLFVCVFVALIKPSKSVRSREGLVDKGVWALTGLAGILAGPHHAHLREAWAADLYDPETSELLPFPLRLRIAAGDLVAAVCCRIDDVGRLAWHLVDALLASWRGSRLAVSVPFTVALGLVLAREGFYGLISDADNLGVIAAAPYAAMKGLRRYRQISTPKRPEKKQPGEKAASANAPGQRTK
jgi:hypothetical protein